MHLARRVFVAALVALVLGAVLGSAGPAQAQVQAQGRFSFATTPGALPKDVVPVHYALDLELDPARQDFGGTATISLQIRRAVDAIVLHADGLQAREIELVGTDGRRQALEAGPGRIPQSWRLHTRPAATLPAGDYTLRIAYRGRVQSTGQGLYAVDYGEPGRPLRMLATQLEATYARSLFPCFDEPAFRATFALTVRAPEGQQVLSNMPLQAEPAAEGGLRVHRFGTTPAMPSYLVAVSVGRFETLGGETAGVPLRIVTAPGRAEAGRYALEVTHKVVPYYNDYFGTPYALPKLDQIAVPGVRGGAMEDWGLISYAEPMLLYDTRRSSPRTQREIFNTVAHEVAHQWFGNLVTAASWEEIWLNEAFATWLATKAQAHFNPDWNTRLRQREWTDRAMGIDATLATRAIRSGPVRESAVFDVFDTITYAKGGAVLSMLEQWIGPDAFRRGLAAYMKGQALSNATAADLWHHMGEASGRDVSAVAASWTDLRGFPLVRVEAECVGGVSRLRLSQQRFLLLGKAPREPRLWKIPVQLARGEQRRVLLLDAPQATVELEGCGPAPLVVNAGGEGFFRVDYDAGTRAALSAAFATLAPADRVALFSDTFALVQAGRLPVTAAFDLFDGLAAIDDPSRATLYAAAIGSLGFLDHALHGLPAQARLRAAARNWLAPALARLGWVPVPGEDPEATHLRNDLIEALAAADDADVVRRALADFDADESGAAPLRPETREGIVMAVGMHADARRFEILRSRLQAATREEDRWMYAAALARGRDPARAKRLLDESLRGRLPSNIASHLPGMVAQEPAHTAVAYDFALRHWPALARLAGGMFGEQVSILPDVATGFVDAARARRLIADQRARAGADGAAEAAKAAQRIELIARVRRTQAQAIGAALLSRTSGT